MDFKKMTDTEKELYSEIEYLIIMWNNDGTRTAGNLTREIMGLLVEKNKIIMERTFNSKEVEEMCKQSYMRGMSIQHDTMTKKKMKPPKVFVEWVKQLINECPVNKFK